MFSSTGRSQGTTATLGLPARTCHRGVKEHTFRKPPFRIRHRKSVLSTNRRSFVWNRAAAVLLCAGSIFSADAVGAPVRVRYKEGLTHGFLVLSTLDEHRIAVGDLAEVVRGNRVTIHLVYHFYDGSLQDETTVFSQRGNFRLISYHLIQKGPSFKQSSDLSIDMSSGQVTVKYKDDKGEEKVENERMKLPQDLANGLVLTLLKNIGADPPPLEVSMVVTTPKPRLVKLEIRRQGVANFSLAGSKRDAVDFVIKVNIGGVAGLLAPVLGKQPPDAHVWIIEGDAPTFVKSEVLSFLGGPTWRTELVSPVWPDIEKPKPTNAEK